MVKCPECDAGADLTKDGTYAHCASCTQRTENTLYNSDCSWCHDTGNTIFEPEKEGSHYRGSGSGSGDKEEGTKPSDNGTEKIKNDKSDGWTVPLSRYMMLQWDFELILMSVECSDYHFRNVADLLIFQRCYPKLHPSKQPRHVTNHCQHLYLTINSVLLTCELANYWSLRSTI